MTDRFTDLAESFAARIAEDPERNTQRVKQALEATSPAVHAETLTAEAPGVGVYRLHTRMYERDRVKDTPILEAILCKHGHGDASTELVRDLARYVAFARAEHWSDEPPAPI